MLDPGKLQWLILAIWRQDFLDLGCSGLAGLASASDSGCWTDSGILEYWISLDKMPDPGLQVDSGYRGSYRFWLGFLILAMLFDSGILAAPRILAIWHLLDDHACLAIGFAHWFWLSGSPVWFWQDCWWTLADRLANRWADWLPDRDVCSTTNIWSFRPPALTTPESAPKNHFSHLCSTEFKTVQAQTLWIKPYWK